MKYIIFGLNNYQDASTCKSCMLAIVDIINILEADSTVILKEVMTMVLNIAKAGDSDKELKRMAIIIFTDIFQYNYSAVGDYFVSIMEIIHFGVEYCKETSKIMVRE